MSACKSGCGASLTWATTPAGKAVPLVRVTTAQQVELAPRGSVYRWVSPQTGYVPAGDRALQRLYEGEELYLSHFVDCPNRAQFKKPRP